MMIEVLTEFYTNHYNFAIIGVLILLLTAFLGTKKNVKGIVLLLSLFLVYNLVLYNKTKKDPHWYEASEQKVNAYDPVKKLWEDKPADDDINKRK
ncbi:MAG: hypothetical protein FWC26_02595 [Fibromonadales bacterium]|nr:hypothetical protein [Fibromonadales bacterium]